MRARVSALTPYVICAVAAVWLFRCFHGVAGLIPLGLCAGLLMASVTVEREKRAGARSDEREQEWRYRGIGPARTLIVGAGEVGRRMARRLEATGRYLIVGFADDNIAEPGADVTILGGRAQTAEIVREHGIEEVVLAYAPTWQMRLLEDLASAQPDVRVSVIPSPYEAMLGLGDVEHLGDIALCRLLPETRRGSELLKRLFDASLSLLLLLLLLPLILVVAVLIKRTSRGPVLFRQERVGRYGKTFTLVKFRTMVESAESDTGPVLSTGRQDARLTPVGRWLRACRVDEVPQLWNVLRGEMSLVGPRPERPYFVRQFEDLTPVYAKRHQVRPGMTGLAQVCGGYHTHHRDKLRFDLIYACRQSLWLDLAILLRTILVVFSSNGS